jgi:hypothetical protein
MYFTHMLCSLGPLHHKYNALRVKWQKKVWHGAAIRDFGHRHPELRAMQKGRSITAWQSDRACGWPTTCYISISYSSSALGA